MLDHATALHLANRFSFGPAPGELDRIAAAGFDTYIEEQLNADPSKLPASMQAQLHSLPSFGLDTLTLYRKYWFKALAQMSPGEKIPHEQKKLLKKVTSEVGPEARMARLIRAISSPDRLHEALVDFWFNHFNVFEHKKNSFASGSALTKTRQSGLMCSASFAICCSQPPSIPPCWFTSTIGRMLRPARTGKERRRPASTRITLVK
jgi:uncharacterized protein (DUF1800 family)